MKFNKSLGITLISILAIWVISQCQIADNPIDIPIRIEGKTYQQIQSFGLDIVFDPAVYEYLSIEKGNLTQTWQAIDGNIIEPGRLRIGGYLGDGQGITGDVNGTLAIVKFKVISDFKLENYVDDIKNMEPDSAIVFVTK